MRVLVVVGVLVAGLLVLLFRGVVEPEGAATATAGGGDVEVTTPALGALTAVPAPTTERTPPAIVAGAPEVAQTVAGDAEPPGSASEPRRILRVTVVDGDDRPVPAATLEAYVPRGSRSFDFSSEVLGVVRTGPGRFDVATPVARHERFRVIAAAPGYSHTVQDVYLRLDGQRMTLPISTAPSVVLRAVRPDGSPLPFELASIVGEWGGAVASARAETGPDGVARFGASFDGESVRVTIGAHGSAVVPLPDNAGRAATAPIVHLGDVVVEGAHRVDGVVLLEDGTPLDGVTISADRIGGHGRGPGTVSALAVTDSDGRFGAVGLQPGSYRVRLRSSVEWIFELAVAADYEVDSRLDVEVAPLVVRASVADLLLAEPLPADAPPTVAQVFEPGPPRTELTVGLQIPADAPHTSIVMPSGAPRLFELRHPAGPLLSAELPFGLDGGRHRLVLERTTEALGTLVVRFVGNGDSAPTVVVAEALEGGRRTVASLGRGLAVDRRSRTATLPDLAPGGYRVTALADHAPAAAVPMGAEQEDGRLERAPGGFEAGLGPRPAPRELSATVELQAGSTTEHVVSVATGTIFRVRVDRADGRSISARIAVAGHGETWATWTPSGRIARFPVALPPGEHTLEVTSAGHRPATVVVRIDGRSAPLVTVALEAEHD